MVDLALSPEQQAVEELFTTFFTREAPTAVARAAEPLGFDPELWRRLRETGAPGMAAEGAGVAELVMAAEALGRAIAPVPLIEHAVASRVVPDDDVLAGEVVAAFAPRPAIDGTWQLVPGGAVADVVVGLDGDELVAVRSPAPGAAPRNHASAPLADRRVDGDRRVVGDRAAFDTALAEWEVLTAAALIGIAATALDMGVAYAKERYQFGVPIGSFQAVQHGLADFPGLIDGGRLLVHKAAWASTAGTPGHVDVDWNDITDPLALAAMAFVFSAEVAAAATDRSLHYHGGYGFAEEYDIQLYYRRARGWALVLDDPSRVCLRLADRLYPEGA